MGADTIFTLQNMPSENHDLDITFCCKTSTAFTLQNMPSESEDIYVPFCYEIEHCLYRICLVKIMMYMYPFVMRRTLALL